jgi:DNA-binding CsgD family transcriptional regulator
VEVYFGVKKTAVKIAHDLDVSELTAQTLINKVKRYLRSEQERALIGADGVLDCLIIKE